VRRADAYEKREDTIERKERRRRRENMEER
jgi:hypothetical protein